MSDSTTLLEQIATAQAAKETTANQLFDAASVAMAYGRHAESCGGLTWAYYGTRYGGTAVANGTNACAASDDTYMVVNLSTGAVSFSTATTNWDNAAAYGRCYKITTGTATVTSYEDHRFGPLGVFAAHSASSIVDQWSVYIATVSDKSYKIIVNTKFAATINEVTTICASGTCTLTTKINTTALGGTANSVSSGEQTQTHSSANSVAAGDDIVLTASSNSACVDMSVTIKYTRAIE